MNDVVRTPRCPKCTMTFRIECPKGQKRWRSSCVVCGVKYYEVEGSRDNPIVVCVDALEPVMKAWV